MKDRKLKRQNIFTVCSIWLVILALQAGTAGCNKGRYLREELEAQQILEEAAQGYASEKWIARHKSIETLNRYLSGLDKAVLQDLVERGGDKTAFEKLLLSASRDVHIAVRIEALKGLAVLSHKNAFDRIASLALHDRSDNVRWYAVMALSLYRDTRAAPVFLKTMEDDDWIIREASIKGILMLDETFKKKNMIPVIIRAIEDPNDKVKEAVLQGVKIRTEEIYGAVSRVFKKRNTMTNSLLMATMKALNGYILDESMRKGVIELLFHKNKKIRLLALQVLKKEKVMKKKKQIQKTR